MFRISYWIFPVLSGLVWLGLLLGLLLGWIVADDSAHYSSMYADQHVAYMSNVGATSRFKPMFIALCCVTTVLLDVAFVCDRWLRHRGRLTPNGSVGQKVLAVCMILFALAGTAGLVLLSVFDVAHHRHLHDGFLVLFIGGYMLSAICACWEFQRLGVHNRDIPVLRLSFWLKLAFILVELALAVTFAVLGYTSRTSAAAVVEWVVSFVFTCYVWSFAVDLYPAVYSHRSRRHRRPICGAQAAAAAINNADPPPADAPDSDTPDSDTPDAHDPEMQTAGDVYGQSAARATRLPHLYSAQLPHKKASTVGHAY